MRVPSFPSIRRAVRSHDAVALASGVLVAIALLAGACGSDDGAAQETATTLAEAEQIRAEGHDDGDTDDHNLAMGANTPKGPDGRYVLHNGDSGDDVTELQDRLIELGADITSDGVYGDSTLHAVMAFQTSEGLTPDGVVGTRTWAALDAPTAEVDWTLPEVPDEYATETPTTAPTPVTAPTGTAPSGDGAAVERSTAPASESGAWAKGVVSLSTQTATFYDAAGNVVLQAPISSGKNGLTPVGTFHVQSKSDPAFAGNGVYMKTMTRFNGGIGFHSIPKRADDSDIATPLGQAAVSHGCVRMADAQAAQVYANLPIGAVVEVHA